MTMTNLLQEPEILLLIVKWAIYFLSFYLTSANVLILLVLINNWGKPMNFSIGIFGVKVEIAHHPASSGESPSDPK